LLIFFIALFSSNIISANSTVLDTSNIYTNAIGNYVSFYQEEDNAMSTAQSLQKFNDGQFIQSGKPVLNFGLTKKPVWIAFKVNNSSSSPAEKRLTIEAPWLDKISLSLITNNQISTQYELGDSYSFEHRPINERFVSVSYNFPVGETTVLARIESADPLVIPLYLSTIEQQQAKIQKNNYLYGLLYGALLSLLAYNFMLFLSLGLSRYLFYSIHLLIFIALNLSYTGHGYQWFWPQSLLWQQWSVPILMHIFGLSGLLFASQFLNSKQLFPRIHKSVLLISGLFISLLLFSMLMGDQSLALLSSIIFISAYGWILITMAVLSLINGNKAARFFLLATVTAAISASITATAASGLIPFNDLTVHAAEIGMVFDAIFLALALAHFFRVSEEKKVAAELANNAKSKFLAAASHDLRQPLYALTLFTEALEHKAENPESLKITKQIGRSVDALQTLLDTLLDISILDAGALEVNKSDFKLKPVLNKLASEFNPISAEKNLLIEWPETLAILHTDPNLLEQILRNFISNAIRYTDTGQIKVTCEPAIKGITINIIDTGIGISKTNQKTIYEEFQQLDNPERDRSKGLGLGLSIVKRTASLLGHKIKLHSSLGQGSTFSITVDSSQYIEPSPIQHETVEVTGIKMLVLLIDDEDDIREGMELLLPLWGCEIVACASEAEAIQVLNDSQLIPDAVICDFRLPGNRNGLDAISAVNNICKTNIPAIIITGDTQKESLAQIHASGYQVLHKPVAPVKLRSFLRTISN